MNVNAARKTDGFRALHAHRCRGGNTATQQARDNFDASGPPGGACLLAFRSRDGRWCALAFQRSSVPTLAPFAVRSCGASFAGLLVLLALLVGFVACVAAMLALLAGSRLAARGIPGCIGVGVRGLVSGCAVVPFRVSGFGGLKSQKR